MEFRDSSCKGFRLLGLRAYGSSLGFRVHGIREEEPHDGFELLQHVTGFQC